MTDIWTQFDTKTEEKWKQLVKKLEQIGLDISVAERKEIVKAIGLGSGHWYKCRNGHVYVIGECGGAMEVRYRVFLRKPTTFYGTQRL